MPGCVVATSGLPPCACSSSKVGTRRLRRSRFKSFVRRSGVSVGVGSSGFFGSVLTP
jgi:hypothetical protein